MDYQIAKSADVIWPTDNWNTAESVTAGGHLISSDGRCSAVPPGQSCPATLCLFHTCPISGCGKAPSIKKTLYFIAIAFQLM